MTSKLEAALANDLHLMSRKADAPWPEAVAQFKPFWCCQHRLAQHSYTAPSGRWRWCKACKELCEQAGERRQFSVDFCWPKQRVICEVEGVNWGVQGGRHQTGAGFSKDLSKYTTLQLAGWTVLRVGAQQIKDGSALSLIEQALGVK